jgi:ABC-type antimicrobial peptide transport system permease subunit
VPDIVQSTRHETAPIIYAPRRLQPAESAWLIARTSVPPASLVTALRRAVQTLDAELPISIVPLTDTFASTYRYRAFTAGLFLMFAIIALLLASLGLYAVIAHSVSQRTQEIGIRIAVGASAREILGLIFRQGMLPLGIGLVAGLAAALALTPVLRASLVRVSPVDPITLALSMLVPVAAALLGCLIPARRAMRVDPIVALRPE